MSGVFLCLIEFEKFLDSRIESGCQLIDGFGTCTIDIFFTALILADKGTTNTGQFDEIILTETALFPDGLQVAQETASQATLSK